VKKIKKLFKGSSLFIKGFLLSVPTFGMIAITHIAMAQTSGNTITAPITDEQDLKDLLCNVIAWFFWIIIVISVIMVLVAAFDYVTAGDDTEKTSRGRRRLTYAAVGIAVALLAAGFPAIVASIFPNAPGTTLADTCTSI
jgi:flagellar biosynthesis protein FlhB